MAANAKMKLKPGANIFLAKVFDGMELIEVLFDFLHVSLHKSAPQSVCQPVCHAKYEL